MRVRRDFIGGQLLPSKQQSGYLRNAGTACQAFATELRRMMESGCDPVEAAKDLYKDRLYSEFITSRMSKSLAKLCMNAAPPDLWSIYYPRGAFSLWNRGGAIWLRLSGIGYVRCNFNPAIVETYKDFKGVKVFPPMKDSKQEHQRQWRAYLIGYGTPPDNTVVDDIGFEPLEEDYEGVTRPPAHARDIDKVDEGAWCSENTSDSKSEAWGLIPSAPANDQFAKYGLAPDYVRPEFDPAAYDSQLEETRPHTKAELDLQNTYWENEAREKFAETVEREKQIERLGYDPTDAYIEEPDEYEDEEEPYE